MKIAVYSKKGCTVCDSFKKELCNIGFVKVSNRYNWVIDTWIERDADELLNGTIDDWREFPDVDVLAFISSSESNEVPIIWIDGDIHFYRPAVDIIRNEFCVNIEQQVICEEKSCKLIA